MKVAFAFLFVALSCYFGSGDTGYVAHKKGSGNAGYVVYQQVSSTVPTIPKDCLEKLLKFDVPKTLERLQEMLCLYMKAMKTQKEELCKQFLQEVHTALLDAGCTVDEILSTSQFLEKVGDKVGEVAKHCGMEILKIVEKLGLNDLVMNVLCDLLGETLKTLSKSLGVLNLNAGAIVGGGVGGGVLKGIPIIG